jgi:hypothetical protein
LEESGRELLEILSQYLPGGTEVNHENPSQDNWCPVGVSNPGNPDTSPQHHRYTILLSPVDQETDFSLLN